MSAPATCPACGRPQRQRYELAAPGECWSITGDGVQDEDCMRLAYGRVTRERDEARLLLLATWVRGHAIGSCSDAQAAALDAMLDPIVAVTTKAERDAAILAWRESDHE